MSSSTKSDAHLDAIAHPTAVELPIVLMMDALMAFSEAFKVETDYNRRWRLCAKAENLASALIFIPGSHGRLDDRVVWAYGQSVIDEMRKVVYADE